MSVNENPPAVSEAAKERAKALLLTSYFCRDTENVARFIQQVSDAAKRVCTEVGHEASEPLAPFILPEPVDPLLIEARKLVAARGGNCEEYSRLALRGDWDDEQAVQNALIALRRGIELGKAST